MKKTGYKLNKVQIIAVSLIFLAMGCKEDESTELALTRLFSPATVTTTNGETFATLAWTPSLFTTTGNVDYVVEVSTDGAAFGTIAYSVTTKDASVVVTDEQLAIKQDYFARVKALGVDGTEDSKWTTSQMFRITGEQFLLPVPDKDISDVGVIIRWKPNAALTKIVLTPASGSPVEVNLTAADHTPNEKTIMNLTQNTAYGSEIFEGVKTKGIATFKTKASITGTNLIDLSGTTGNPALLVTTLGSAPSGSVIILRRGESYTVTSYSFSGNKSVTIRTALGFGTNYAIIRSGGSFNVAATNVIDSIVFRDLIIKGLNTNISPPSYDNHYVFNVNAVCTIDKIRFENCTIKILRGVVRGQTAGAGAKFNNYFVNNCVIDSIRDFSIVQVSGGSSFGNIKITNSTIYKSRKFINHGTSASTSVLVENCTINEAPSNNGTNYFIDYNTFNVANGIVLKNCIFGKTWDEGGTIVINGYRAGSNTALSIVTSYATSDFTFGANPVTGTIGYSGTATNLFTNPATGDFTIKDTNFPGKSSSGDPRWRLN